jgi:hypothetical protein
MSQEKMLARFERDLLYLQQNQSPKENSGKAVHHLDYQGNEEEKLTDAQVEKLAQALLLNDKFSGPLNLNDNDLSDLAALAIASVLRKS